MGSYGAFGDRKLGASDHEVEVTGAEALTAQ